ncbi:sulfotransferase [Pseudomonadota bacterium]
MHFCIIGTGRCGSTLLKNMFNLHPDVFVFNETHWIPRMYDMFGTGPGGANELINVLLNTYHISGDKVLPVKKEQLLELFSTNERVTVQQFCNRIGLMLAGRHGKRMWADKTPDYGPWMFCIQRLWPNCKFVHLIRHGANVAVSMSRHPGYQWLVSANEDYWPPVSFNKYFSAVSASENPVEAYGDLWCRRLKRIRNEAQLLKGNSYREFHLESFASDIAGTLRAIADFVDLPFSEEWLLKSQEILDVNRICNARHSSDALKGHALDLLHEIGYT